MVAVPAFDLAALFLFASFFGWEVWDLYAGVIPLLKKIMGRG